MPLKRDDLVLVTAGHGGDPPWRGTDHTHEATDHQRCPDRSTLADVAMAVSARFGLPSFGLGTRFSLLAITAIICVTVILSAHHRCLGTRPLAVDHENAFL